MDPTIAISGQQSRKVGPTDPITAIARSAVLQTGSNGPNLDSEAIETSGWPSK